MSYYTLFCIIISVLSVLFLIFYLKCSQTKSVDTFGMLLLYISILQIGLWGSSSVFTKSYKNNLYDCNAIYDEFLQDPNCLCSKTTKPCNQYYKNDCEQGIIINPAYQNQIKITKLIGGKYRVKYIIYTPSEQAIEQKTQWMQIEQFRIQDDIKENL